MATSGEKEMWSISDTDSLIYLVQKYECLYNTKHKGYKSNEMKDNAFQEIAKRLKRGAVHFTQSIISLSSCIYCFLIIRCRTKWCKESLGENQAAVHQGTSQNQKGKEWRRGEGGFHLGSPKCHVKCHRELHLNTQVCFHCFYIYISWQWVTCAVIISRQTNVKVSNQPTHQDIAAGVPEEEEQEVVMTDDNPPQFFVFSPAKRQRSPSPARNQQEVESLSDMEFESQSTQPSALTTLNETAQQEQEKPSSAPSEPVLRDDLSDPSAPQDRLELPGKGTDPSTHSSKSSASSQPMTRKNTEDSAGIKKNPTEPPTNRSMYLLLVWLQFL